MPADLAALHFGRELTAKKVHGRHGFGRNVLLVPDLVEFVDLGGAEPVLGIGRFQALVDEELHGVFIDTVVSRPLRDGHGRDEAIFLELEAAAHEPGENARQLILQQLLQIVVARAVLFALWLIHKAVGKVDHPQAFPKSGVVGRRARQEVGEQEEGVGGAELGVLPVPQVAARV